MFSGRGKDNEGQDKKKKNRFSSEYTMLSILEYLYTNSQMIPVTKYNIVTNTPGIKLQRPDRVSLMINSLEKNGYVISVNTSSSLTFYKITQSGIDAYEKWIKDFLEFARNTNITTAEATYATAKKESIKKNGSDNTGDVVIIVW